MGVNIVQQRRTFLLTMKFIHIFLFLNFVATLAHGQPAPTWPGFIDDMAVLGRIITDVAQVCLTEEHDGGLNTAKGGLSCVFPFRYNEIVYNSCTFVATSWGQGPWCSTETNSDGDHQIFNWGFCNEHCP